MITKGKKMAEIMIPTMRPHLQSSSAPNRRIITNLTKKATHHGRPDPPVYRVAIAIAKLLTSIAMYHHMGTSGYTFIFAK